MLHPMLCHPSHIWQQEGLVHACMRLVTCRHTRPMPDDIAELRWAADRSLQVTKEMAHAIGYSRAALVDAERHLWLNLLGIKEKDGFSD